jgi:primosomal protein N'
VSGEGEAAVRDFIERAARLIENMKENGVEILGPVPAVLAKVNRSYRYGMILKSASAAVLQRVVYRLRHSLGRPPKELRLVVDVDPLSML